MLIKIMSKYLEAGRERRNKMTREEIIEELFCDSREMREHLLKPENCGDCDLLDAVCAAPISLQRKLQILEAYEFDAELHCDGEHTYPNRLTTVRESVAQLKAKYGDVFLWRNRWYEPEMSKVEPEPIDQFAFRPCRSIEEVFEDVQAMIASEKDGSTQEYQDCVDERFEWIQIKKFELKPNEQGKTRLSESPWTWIAIKDKVCYADYSEYTVPKAEYSKTIPDNICIFSHLSSMDLNLRIPFKVGDVVTVDCRPFAPYNHMVLTDVGDGCCSVQVAFENENGKWEGMSLKHGHCFTDNYSSVMSALYRLTSYDKRKVAPLQKEGPEWHWFEGRTLTRIKDGEKEAWSEGAKFKSWLKALQPLELQDVIALYAMYRPGEAKKIPHYIARKKGEEKIKYLHPLMVKHLKETYGLILYQEQIEAILCDLAGYPAWHNNDVDAKDIRRALAKRDFKMIRVWRGDFIKRCEAREEFRSGVSDPTALARKIWTFLCDSAFVVKKTTSNYYATLTFEDVQKFATNESPCADVNRLL